MMGHVPRFTLLNRYQLYGVLSTAISAHSLYQYRSIVLLMTQPAMQ